MESLFVVHVCHILAFCLSPAPEPRYFERATTDLVGCHQPMVGRAEAMTYRWSLSSWLLM